jgi:ribosomal protein S12 methylthiotransferase accessory factor YcaO
MGSHGTGTHLLLEFADATKRQSISRENDSNAREFPVLTTSSAPSNPRAPSAAADVHSQQDQGVPDNLRVYRSHGWQRPEGEVPAVAGLASARLRAGV